MGEILFVGDIMPGGVFHYEHKFIEEELLSFMKRFTLRVGTLEAAIGNYAFDPIKLAGRNNIIYANNEDMDLVDHIGMNVLALANNHVCDLGKDGLINTIKLCHQRCIAVCGAGENLEEAMKPAVVSCNENSIAFLSYCEYGNESMGYVKYATKEEYGVAPLIIDQVVKDIKYCKSKYDYVIVLPHWGEEYEYLPTPINVMYARMMIDAGADAVMSSHTHIVSPMMKYRGKPVYFGMGNFMFPDHYIEPPRPMFYPTISEISSIKKVFGYPFPIYDRYLCVWESIARIGMAISFNITDKSSSYKLVSLSENNVVGFLKKWSILLKRLRVKLLGICICFRYYSLIYKCYKSRWNLVRLLWHRITGISKYKF